MTSDRHPVLHNEQLIGSKLESAVALLFDPSVEVGPPMRIALTLQFSNHSLTIEAVGELDTISVTERPLSEVQQAWFEPDERPADWRQEDSSGSQPFKRFVGLPLHNWWFLESACGLVDGFMIAFGHCEGLCFVTMGSQIGVQVVEGEQFS